MAVIVKYTLKLVFDGAPSVFNGITCRKSPDTSGTAPVVSQAVVEAGGVAGLLITHERTAVPLRHHLTYRETSCGFFGPPRPSVGAPRRSDKAEGYYSASRG